MRYTLYLALVVALIISSLRNPPVSEPPQKEDEQQTQPAQDQSDRPVAPRIYPRPNIAVA